MSAAAPRIRERLGRSFIHAPPDSSPPSFWGGGGTHSGFLADAILQFISLPIFVAALWRISNPPVSRERLWALAFCAAILAVPLAQFAATAVRLDGPAGARGAHFDIRIDRSRFRGRPSASRRGQPG